jgi:hypothetical protein
LPRLGSRVRIPSPAPIKLLKSLTNFGRPTGGEPIFAPETPSFSRGSRAAGGKVRSRTKPLPACARAIRFVPVSERRRCLCQPGCQPEMLLLTGNRPFAGHGDGWGGAGCSMQPIVPRPVVLKFSQAPGTAPWPLGGPTRESRKETGCIGGGSGNKQSFVYQDTSAGLLSTNCTVGIGEKGAPKLRRTDGLDPSNASP